MARNVTFSQVLACVNQDIALQKVPVARTNYAQTAVWVKVLAINSLVFAYAMKAFLGKTVVI